jgi:hypothetical protein
MFYAARLVLGKHLGHVGVIRILARINIRKRLSIGVADFESSGYRLNRPWWWEASHRLLWGSP